jgi:general secretion pathway protein G
MFRTQHPARSTRHHAGYTFIELLVVSTIIIILASAVMPLVKVTARRQHEAELRRALREMRTAIDKYKDAADLGQVSPLELRVGNENYPPSLETLVEGMTHSTEWGLRSYQDEPDATSWSGDNVFDVYTKYDGTALDGSKYRDW